MRGPVTQVSNGLLWIVMAVPHEMCIRDRGVPVLEFPADWVRLGKRAGMVRNLQMLDSADAVVAFWDGQSRGTAHMINETKKRGLPLRVVRYQKGG